MAFASSGVPDCWAIANPEHHNITKAANIDVDKFLLMAFSLSWTANLFVMFARRADVADIRNARLPEALKLPFKFAGHRHVPLAAHD
jgi:hypothetical protein